MCLFCGNKKKKLQGKGSMVNGQFLVGIGFTKVLQSITLLPEH